MTHRHPDTTGSSRRYANVAMALCLCLYLVPPMEPEAAGTLVAAYSFDEGSGTVLNDLSGNGNQGTLTNGPVWSTGKYGGALTFDGANDLVTINDAASLRLTNAITLEAWVKSTSSSSWRSVLVKEIPGDLSYALYANTSTNRPSAQITTNTAFDIRGPSQLALNTWVHLAATYDGATLKLYLNGVVVGSKAASGNLKATADPLRIGGNLVWGEYFKGQIDDVRIYNSVLTQAQIQTDMNTPVAASAADTTVPAVSLIAPSDGGLVAGSAVSVSATASDNVSVAGVQFKLDGANVGAEDLASPYGLNWDTTAAVNGSHTITAVARDAAGNRATSTPVSVVVSNVQDTTPPAVSLSAPGNGSTVANTISIDAAVSDDVGVVGVQFLLDGNPAGTEDTNSPYSTTWNTNTTTNGAHVLSAVARDAAGNTATASTVSVTVGNGSTGLSFDDEFNGTAVDTNAWFVMNRHADYSNNELNCYTPSNVVEAGGMLTITTRVQAATCGDATHAPVSRKYTSGMIQWNTYNYTYGTIEMRARMAGGTGVWPALWLHGIDCQVSNQTGADNFGGCDWPNPGSDEIDVTEIVGGVTSVNQAIHTAQGSYRCTATTTDVTQNWHVYDLVWSPGKLVWHIDGRTTCTLTTAVSTTPKFLIINTAVSAGGGSVDDSTLPQTLSIDYVRVTTSGGGATPPGDTSVPVVSMTAPANNSTVSGPIAVSATASDNVAVVGVQFLLDGSPVGAEATALPYSLNWDSATTANGTHRLSARARDAAGNVATSTVVNVTVNNAVGATTIDFNSRQGNSGLSGPYPTGVIDWGTNVWWVASPWRLFTTNSISFNRAGMTSGSFSFISPRRLISVRAYNGGTTASTVTLSCAGNTTKVQSVAANQLLTISTGWTVGCSTVTVGSSNGWDTNLDDVTFN